MRRRESGTAWVRWVEAWWSGRGGAAGWVLNGLLWPAELAFRGGVAARNAAFDRGWLPAARAPLPVVSVGNLGVGGSGKTPLTAWLAARLEARGRAPAVVLRGYARDEVLLHGELNPTIPVIASPRRADAALRAVAAGRDVVVLDDAFQHRWLQRDLDIVLVPADAWYAKRRLLPRGPWREPAASLRRASVVVVTRKAVDADAAEAVREELRRLVPERAVLTCRLEPEAIVGLNEAEPLPLEAVAGRSVLAVAALATPGPFARNLAALGADVELAAFPDHHEFTDAEAAALRVRAGARCIVMTAKDAVKLRPLFDRSVEAYVLRQRVCLGSDADLLDALLHQALERSDR